VNKELMATARRRAIAAVALSAVLQLSLWFYSLSHPSVSDLVTASFLFVIVFYPAVFEYHARKMKTARRLSCEPPLDSN
jgi:hypothetical protein